MRIRWTSALATASAAAIVGFCLLHVTAAPPPAAPAPVTPPPVAPPVTPPPVTPNVVPATSPAGATTRRTMDTPPPGFVKGTVPGSGMVLFYLPKDKDWVMDALKGIKPTTRANMPTEMAEKLGSPAVRSKMLAGLKADLGLSDDKALADKYDTMLVGREKMLTEWQPSVYYLVTTPQLLTTAVKAGWGRPQFGYNGVSEQVEYNPRYNVPETGKADDTVLPVFYDDQKMQTTIVKAVQTQVEQSENNRVAGAASIAQSRAVQQLMALVKDVGIEPLKLKRDQEWLGLAVTGYLAAKYAPSVTEFTKEKILNDLAQFNPQVVDANTVNLLAPTDKDVLRKEVVPYYEAAMRARSLAVLHNLIITRGEKGEEVIGKIMAKVREAKPADGAALVKAIQEAINVDLTRDLGGK